MAYHNSSGSAFAENDVVDHSLRGIAGEMSFSECSGDERDSRTGEERTRNDLNEKPIYLLEHLATFTVNKDSGIVYPADGMRRLLQLEKSTGIWSQKMQLCLDYQWVLILDYETGNIIERFPASLIQEPTAFTSTDTTELYNNILVFIVCDGSDSRSEMHIFQSQNVFATHLVEDLKSLRNGKLVTHQREDILQYQQTRQLQLSQKAGGRTKPSAISKPFTASVQLCNDQEIEQLHHLRSVGVMIPSRSSVNQNKSHAGSFLSESNHAGGCGGSNNETDSEQGALNDETSSTCSDKYERDVTVLNHCFDDIEKFIARLQHAAAASRELDRRRCNRKTKKKDPGEGLLTLRTRPPNEKEFIDIFAKFKLSFNLLAKLKAHIHDPNAPELVHFLFTPLALIVEASSDTYYECQLPACVVNPLLTREAINLLTNCVTSKETELWRSLGDSWIVPRDMWKKDVGSYHPVFMDGRSPEYFIRDELETPKNPTHINKLRLPAQTHLYVGQTGHSIVNGTFVGVSNNLSTTALQPDEFEIMASSEIYCGHYERDSERLVAAGDIGSTNDGGLGDFSTRSEISIDSIERSGTDPHGLTANNNSGSSIQAISTSMQQLHTRDTRRSERTNTAPKSSGRLNNANDEQFLDTWLEDLKATGAKIILVTYPRTANNDKELSVIRGEYLENMGKIKQKLSSKLSSYVQQYPVFKTDGGVLYCKLCNKSVSADKLFNVKQHLQGLTLKALEGKQTKELRNEQLITQNRTLSKTEQFAKDLCDAFVSADIPLFKIRNEKLNVFLQKYSELPIPSESTLRRNIDGLFEQTMDSIRAEIRNKYVWITIDETTDKEGRCIGNVIIGVLDSEGPSKKMLLNSAILEKADHVSIASLFDNSIKLLGNDFNKDNILLFLSDAAPYMKKAASVISVFNPKIMHLTCLALALHRVCETIRDLYPNVDKWVATVKKYF